MEPIKKFDLVKQLVRDLEKGKFDTLFFYLEQKKIEELKVAQNFAKNSEFEKASASILVTSVYDIILGWQDGGGSLIQELDQIKKQIEFSQAERSDEGI